MNQGPHLNLSKHGEYDENPYKIILQYTYTLYYNSSRMHPKNRLLMISSLMKLMMGNNMETFWLLD
jgi:hypothetical protein